MTEPEWAAATDPAAMLTFAAPRLSDRKLRLFLVGCCRRRWELFAGQRWGAAVETAERAADGRATAEGLNAAAWDALRAGEAASREYRLWPDQAAHAAHYACCTPAELRRQTTYTDADGRRKTEVIAASAPRAAVRAWASRAAAAVPGGGSMWRETVAAAERAAQAHLLRCVAGSPFAYTVPDPGWQTAAVQGLAESIYEARDFAALPVLADALEEAGCDDRDVLTHCRQHREHARGCWVIDLLLGKE